MRNSEYCFMVEMAHHLDGWSLDTSRTDHNAGSVVLINDDAPDARIVVGIVRGGDALTVTLVNPPGAAALGIHPWTSPAINVDSDRGPAAVAREVRHLLRPDMLFGALTIGERAQAVKARLAATDDAVDAIAALLPAARTEHGQAGQAYFAGRVADHDIEAAFRLTDGTIKLSGLRPHERVALAETLAGIIAARTQSPDTGGGVTVSGWNGITALAAHLPGWTLESSRSEYETASRVAFVNGSDPRAVITVAYALGNDDLITRALFLRPTSVLGVAFLRVPRGRPAKDMAADIIERLAPQVLDYAAAIPQDPEAVGDVGANRAE